jgi:hypothetical protein
MRREINWKWIAGNQNRNQNIKRFSLSRIHSSSPRDFSALLPSSTCMELPRNVPFLAAIQAHKTATIAKMVEGRGFARNLIKAVAACSIMAPKKKKKLVRWWISLWNLRFAHRQAFADH